MKIYSRNLNRFCLVIVATLVFSSCEEYLDKEPESIISEEEAFKNFTNFQGFTEELYHCIPDFSNAYWTNSWNWGDDEITSADMNFHVIHKFDNGNFWGWQTEHDGWGASWLNQADASRNDDRMQKDLWKNGWYGLRKVNLGLENLDLLVDATPAERDFIAASWPFLCAYRCRTSS